ncbi:MAG: hypothetical protein OXU81_00140 [Gammaproteobacteria bacterium]|nr:hypothetical protein [Gammaproteobacteria bacterium]
MRLTEAVDRLTEIRNSIDDLNKEANRIRAHIRDFEIDVNAVNILTNVRCRDKAGDGTRLLVEVVEYARRTGMTFEAMGPFNPSVVVASAASGPRDGQWASGEVREVSQSKWKTVYQFALAVAITFGLFALVH